LISFKEKCKPAISKKALLVIAGVMWCCVGVILTGMAANWLYFYKGSPRLFAVTGLFIALIVHHFGFLKVVDKNLGRISQLPQKPCAFSFISFKSYILIIVMISMGIALRHSSLPKQYLSIVYIGIGVALFLSSIRYFKNLFVK